MTRHRNSQRSIGFQGEMRAHEYSIYIGDPIRVHTPNMAYQGVLIDVRGGLMYLNPALVREDLPLAPNGDHKSIYRAVMQRRKPTTVMVERVEGIEPLSMDYLDKLARRLNEVGRQARSNSKRKGKPRSSR